LKLPEVKRNKFEVVIDPGHGGPDPGAIGIGGIRETDVVLEVSKIVEKLLSEKGVKVRLTRINEVDLDLPPRVSIANNTEADIFVSIHANASRGKRRDINGLETFYFRGWRGRLLAKRILCLVGLNLTSLNFFKTSIYDYNYAYPFFVKYLNK